MIKFFLWIKSANKQPTTKHKKSKAKSVSNKFTSDAAQHLHKNNTTNGLLANIPISLQLQINWLNIS